MSSTLISFILIIIIFVLVIIYAIVMYEMAKNKTGIFSLYKPEPTFDALRPMGETIPLTQEDIDKRVNLVAKALADKNKTLPPTPP